MVRAGLMEGAAEGGQTYLDRFESSGADRNAAMRAALGNTAMNVPINMATNALGYGVGSQLARGAVANTLGRALPRQMAERAAESGTSALSALLSEGAQETAQNLSSQYWGGDQPLGEVLSGENIGAQIGDAGSVGGAVGLLTNLALRGLGARQLRRAARGLPDDASVNANIEQLQAREDAGTNQQVIDALTALQAQRQALTDYNQSGYTDVRLDAINRATDSRNTAQKLLRALQEQDNAAQAQQQQETQTAEQTQATTQESPATQTEQTQPPQTGTETDVQTLLNGVNSDLDRVEGILAENTDQRTVDAFTRYRARLSRAQTALNSAAEMKTGKKRAENINSAKRDIESANEIIYAFRDMLATSSQTQQPQTAQNPETQSTTTPAPAQAPAPTAPQPQAGNDARVQVLNELIVKREDKLDERLKRSKGKHTPAVKQLNTIIKNLRKELESYETGTAPATPPTQTQPTASQPQQTETPTPPASTTTDGQAAPAPEAQATSNPAPKPDTPPAPLAPSASEAGQLRYVSNESAPDVARNDMVIGDLQRAIDEIRRTPWNNGATANIDNRVARLEQVPPEEMGKKRNASLATFRRHKAYIEREHNRIDALSNAIRSREAKHNRSADENKKLAEERAEREEAINGLAQYVLDTTGLESQLAKAQQQRDETAGNRVIREAPRIHPSALDWSANDTIDSLVKTRGWNSNYLRQTVVPALRDFGIALGKVSGNIPGVKEAITVDNEGRPTSTDPMSQFKEMETRVHSGQFIGGLSDAMASKFDSVAESIGESTPAHREAAVKARNLAAMFRTSDVAAAIKNVRDIQRVLNADSAYGNAREPNDWQNFKEQTALHAEMYGTEDRLPEEPEVETVEAVPVEPRTAPAPSAPIPADRRQEGTVSDPREAELRAGAREARRQTQVEAAKKVVADNAAKNDVRIMERAARVQLPEGVINLNLKSNMNNPRTMADFATSVDAAIAALSNPDNIDPYRKGDPNEYLRKLRVIKSAYETGTFEDVAKALKDSELIIGNYVSYDEAGDASQVFRAEGKSTNRKTTKPNPFMGNREASINESSEKPGAEVRGTTDAGGDDAAVYGKISGPDLGEHTDFATLPLKAGALDGAKAEQKTRQRKGVELKKRDMTDPHLPVFTREDFRDDAKRKQIKKKIEGAMRSAQNTLDGTRQDKKKANGPKQREKLGELIKKGRLVLDHIGQGESQPAEQRNARLAAFEKAYDALTDSSYNYGFKTDTATNRLYSVDDILNKKYPRASIDGNANSELFVVDRETLQNLFGPKARVSEAEDGSYDVRLPNGLGVHITERDTIEMPEGSIVRGYGRDAAERVRSGKSKVAGSYYSQDDVAFIDLLRGSATKSVMNHEMFHWVSDVLLTPEQRRALQARFGGKDVSLDQFEENMANGFADWKAGRSQPTSTIRAIFRRIADFFSRLRSMFTGENVEDIFRSVESGRIWEQGGSQSSSFRRPQIIGDWGANNLDRADGDRRRIGLLSQAEDMERHGATPSEIWQTTGWVRDLDDTLWKMEVPDSPEMLEGVASLRVGETKKLPEVYDNPDLYRTYPELLDTNVTSTQTMSGEGGFFSERDNTIYFDDSEVGGDFLKEIIVHETQHAIQRIEGIDGGTNVHQARKRVIATRDTSNMTEQELDDAAYEEYRNNKGEIDADNVVDRMYMSSEGKRLKSPMETSKRNPDRIWFNQGGEWNVSSQRAPQDSGRESSIRSGLREDSANDEGEVSQGTPGVDGRGDTGSGGLNRVLSEATSTPTRRPSIVTTSEEARREGERVVSEGKKNVSTISKYLEPNGGNGIGQRVLDAVVPLVFNANRMVGRILGWDVFDRLERGLATSPGKAVYKIEHGDAEAGVKGFGEILGDIPAELRDLFETIAAYFNLRDIAGDRRLLMEQRERYKALANDEKRNAEIILRDLRKNRAIYSGEEIRQYEDAAAGSRKLADEYLKQAAEIQKTLDHKQTAKTADWYDAEINKALAEHPEWEGKIQDLIKWGQYQLQEFVDMGVVSEEVAARVRSAHPNYIPLMRNEESNLFESLDQTAKRYQQGILDMADPLKRYKGDSEATLSSPVEQLINMQYRIESMKARQDVLNMVADGIDAGRYEDLFRRIQNDDELQRGEVAMSIYRNGEKITYAVNEAVRALIDAHNPQQATKLDNILRIPGVILREGVTRSPSFAISNAIRDTFTSAIINPEVRPVIDTVRGLMSVLTNDTKFDDFLKHGGDQQMRWSTRDQRRQNTANLYKKTQTISNPKSVARYAWDFLGSLAEKSELATRVGTYTRLVESGVSPDEAAFRTINTMWFGRGGTASRSQYGRNIPFLNAALQGTYSLGRAFSKDGHFQWNPKAAMNGLLYLTIPSMLLTLWNLGDDDRREKYLEIPEQQKNTNWNLVLGDTILKLPKPHAPGIAFSSLAERFMDYLYANDRRAFDGLVGSLIDSIGPDMTPSFMRLPFELMLNKSLFYQRDIVPASELRYEPLDQYGPYTSDTARWMARAIYAGTSPILNLLGEDGWQVSPRKIEYAINQLTGNLGRDVLARADAGVRAVEGTERPAREWYQNYSIPRRFASSADAMRRTENDFREGLDAALAAVSSASLHAKTDGRAGLPERERRALGAKNAIQQLQTKELRAITTLRKEIRDIAGDKRMDGERKRRLIDVREAKIRRIAEAGLHKLDRIWNR